MYEENCTILKKDRDDRITFFVIRNFSFPRSVESSTYNNFFYTNKEVEWLKKLYTFSKF